MYEHYTHHLFRLKQTRKHRKLPEDVHSSHQKSFIDFSTNDYLGLSRCPELLDAAMLAGKIYGVGATGSRLLSGNRQIFESLEMKIAKDKGTETALVFNSGFQTNLSVLSSLLDSKVLQTKPVVFFDKLNHASLYQAVFLSKADLVRYHHNDMNHLSMLLKKYANDKRPKFIVAETVFGMEGDILPLHEIVSLATDHQAFLYLDEAHATGVMGCHGYGLSTTVDLKNTPHLVMGTFSKALGSSGGYSACNQVLKDYLINKASGFIYSTASSPLTAAAASKAWDKVRGFNAERIHLFSLANTLRHNLVEAGFNIGTSSSHIIPVILGEEEAVLQMQEKLFQKGILVSCIRPPTVSPATSRIRIALTIHHTHQDISQLMDALKRS